MRAPPGARHRAAHVNAQCPAAPSETGVSCSFEAIQVCAKSPFGDRRRGSDLRLADTAGFSLKIGGEPGQTVTPSS